jgi:hypothetical protein
MRLLSLCLAVLALALAANLSSATAATPTYCAKAIKKAKGKRDAKVAGVTVFHAGRTVYACSDKRRKSVALSFMGTGQKVAKVKAAKARCVAIVVAGNSGLPEIIWKDLASKETSTSVTTIGYGQTSAKVESLAVTTNCAAAWGESVTSGASTAYAVKARGIGSGTSLPAGSSTTVATPATADDVRHVTAAASGTRVVVGWTEAGVKQSKTLP